MFADYKYTHIFITLLVLCCHMLHEQLRVYEKRLWPKCVLSLWHFFFHEKPVQYSQHITFWQVLNSIATALYMSDNSGIRAWSSTWAVIYGTLIGFIMISIIIILTTILSSPMHRYVVCNKIVFWHSFSHNL